MSAAVSGVGALRVLVLMILPLISTQRFCLSQRFAVKIMGTLTSSWAVVSWPECRTPPWLQGESRGPGFQVLAVVLDVKHGAGTGWGHEYTVRVVEPRNTSFQP